MLKSSALVALIIVVALSLVVFAELNGRGSSPVSSTTATSSASTSTRQGSTTSSGSASTSSTQQESTNSSGSRTVLSAFIAIGQDYKALFVAPGVTMNYTIKISQLDTTAVNLTLSASSPIPGITVSANPNDLTLAGTQELVTLGISVAPTVTSATIPVVVIASSGKAATNSTFDFVLNKSLIVVTPFGEVVPPTLHVSAGQTVTWLNLMGTQEGDPVVANVALVDGSAASPTLSLNDLWTHTFDKPGTYSYQVALTGTPTALGVVIVG